MPRSEVNLRTCREIADLHLSGAIHVLRIRSRGNLILPNKREPVVEQSKHPDDAAERNDHALRVRIRQQEILSGLGVMALQGASFDELLSSAARLTAEGLEAEFCKIMQWFPDRQELLVVAGVGWGAEVVGQAVIGTDLASPAGFALVTGKPVISNHLDQEERFRTPELLLKYGIRRAINVILQGDGAPFGVLEVDSRSAGEFGEHDLTFLQGTANILGMAIERQRYEERLKAALDRQQVLLKEVNHRVKNSLQLVASMLRLQAGSVDEAVGRLLNEAQSRVMAVARAHERLYKSTDVARLDLAAYLEDVCADLAGLTGSCTIVFEAPKQVTIETDRAIPLALLVTELATNCAKYAYPMKDGGPIRVSLGPAADGMLLMSVADDGVGLPEGFDPGATQSLGLRLIRAFAQGLGGTVEFCRRTPGTEVKVLFPRQI